MFVLPEQIKFHFSAEVERVALLLSRFDSLYQYPARICYERRTVGAEHGAEHSDDFAVFGSPRKHGKSGRVGVQKKIAVRDVAEACDRGSVYRYAELKRAFEFGRH